MAHQTVVISMDKEKINSFGQAAIGETRVLREFANWVYRLCAGLTYPM